jgi:hypothetical protein
VCDSGSFADEPRAFAGGRNGRINIVIDTVYTCEDGSGTFFAQKHVHTSCLMRTLDQHRTDPVAGRHWGLLRTERPRIQHR